MIKEILLLTVSLLLLGGCATPPEAIAPAYVSDIGYLSLSCDQLAAEQSRLQSALASASDAQRKARSGDTVGVIFLGLPTASLSGSNQASYIARLKGELEAVQRAAVRNDCGLGTISTPAVTSSESEKDVSTPEQETVSTTNSEDKKSSTVRDLARDPRRNQSRY